MPGFLQNIKDFFSSGDKTPGTHANSTPQFSGNVAELKVPEIEPEKDEPTLQEQNLQRTLRDRERGVTISQSNRGEDEVQKARRGPDILRKVGTEDINLGNFLFGEGPQTAMNSLYQPDSIQQDIVEQGILGWMQEGFHFDQNPTRREMGERIYDRYSILRNKGEDEQTAINVAIQDLINQTPQNPMMGVSNIDDLKNPNIELTDEQKDALWWTNALENTFAVLDAPIFLGTTKPVTRGTREVAEAAEEPTRSLTGKIIDAIGDRARVSRQYLEDLLNKPDIKGPEKDIARQVLDETPEGGKVDAQDFADRMEERFLPLDKTDINRRSLPNEQGGIRYQSVNLPEAQRGDNYTERIYEGPFQTGAAGVHFDHLPVGQGENYLAHVRFDEVPEQGTRRVLEIQSDMFQKGRVSDEIRQTEEFIETARRRGDTGGVQYGEKTLADYNRLKPYENRWYERVIREETKDAAQSGVRTMQFPTGQTAMKVEGLGGTNSPWMRTINNGDDSFETGANLVPQDIKQGEIITREDLDSLGAEDLWVVVDDADAATGQFTAIPKSQAEDLFEEVIGEKPTSLDELNGFIADAKTDSSITTFTEQFSIAENIDKDNPIFKFYDSTLRKYLKKRYNAKEVTDADGNTWLEYEVDPRAANQPVEAFGAAAGVQVDEEGELEGFDPVAALIGVGAFAAARKARGKVGQGHKDKVIKETDESSVLIETPDGKQLNMLKRPEDQTAVFYHGTTAEDAASIVKYGPNPERSVKVNQESPDAFFVGDITEAGMYGDNFVEVRPREGASIKTLSSDTDEFLQIVNQTDGMGKSIREAAAKAGYDAMYYGDEVEILRPGKFEYNLKGSNKDADQIEKAIATAENAIEMQNKMTKPEAHQAMVVFQDAKGQYRVVDQATFTGSKDTMGALMPGSSGPVNGKAVAVVRPDGQSVRVDSLEDSQVRTMLETVPKGTTQRLPRNERTIFNAAQKFSDKDEFLSRYQVEPTIAQIKDQNLPKDWEPAGAKNQPVGRMRTDKADPYEYENFEDVLTETNGEEYVQKMVDFLKANPDKDLPPVLVRGRLSDPKLRPLVVDGMHRMQAYRQAWRENIPFWYDNETLEEVWDAAQKTAPKAAETKKPNATSKKMNELADDEDWQAFAEAGGDYQTIEQMFRQNAGDNIESEIGERLLTFAKGAEYDGSDNRSMAMMFVNNAKLSDPELYQKLKDRTAQSGTPLPNRQDPVEGFIQEQLDYLYPQELREYIGTSEGGMRRMGDIIGGGSDTTRAAETQRPRSSERRFITRTRNLEPNMDEFLEGTITPRSTDELAERADELIKTDPDKAKEIAKEGTDDFAVAVASRLIDSHVNTARQATDKLSKTEAWEKAADVANDAARNLTAHGRAIQAASLLGRTTPEGMVRFAARSIQNHNSKVDRAKNPVEKTLGGLLGTQDGKALKKAPELTPEQAQSITDKMYAIQEMTDETEKAIALTELQDEIRSFTPDSLYKKIVTVWKAGLLTGFKTTGLNIASNTAHFAIETIKDVPASVVDMVASLFTGKRTLALTNKGVPSGLYEGAKKGWRYWKTGFDERDIGAKLDYRKVSFGRGKFARAIQKYEETVFRTIGSQDQPFYYAAKARSLASQAIADAKNKGLRGKEAKQHAEKLMQNPTDDMLKYAVLDGETMVFQNKTTLGTAARAIQRLPGGEIVLPFGKTPSAVATQIINYSPVGIVKTIIENAGKGKFDQRLFSQGMGRGITGAAPYAIGMALYQNDLLTLGYPSSGKEREQWELEGRNSNSIKINGEWRNLGVLGPAGLLLTIGGHMQNGINETGSFVGGLAQSAAGFGNTLTEQSFLRGINQAIEAIQDPNTSFNGFASSLAGSIVPTLIADIARATDEYERDTSSPGERLQSRIPGVRQGLEPRTDTLGNKVKTQDFWTVMIDATRPGNASAQPDDEPVVNELRRLMDAGHSATPTSLGPRGGYESLTPEQNTFLRRLAGTAAKQKMEEFMRRSVYRRLDDEQRADELNKLTQDVKVEARARAVLRATDGLEGQALTRKLAEMKEEGLLTRQVFDRYQNLKRRQ